METELDYIGWWSSMFPPLTGAPIHLRVILGNQAFACKRGELKHLVVIVFNCSFIGGGGLQTHVVDSPSNRSFAVMGSIYSIFAGWRGNSKPNFRLLAATPYIKTGYYRWIDWELTGHRRLAKVRKFFKACPKSSLLFYTPRWSIFLQSLCYLAPCVPVHCFFRNRRLICGNLQRDCLPALEPVIVSSLQQKDE